MINALVDDSAAMAKDSRREIHDGIAGDGVCGAHFHCGAGSNSCLGEGRIDPSRETVVRQPSGSFNQLRSLTGEPRFLQSSEYFIVIKVAAHHEGLCAFRRSVARDSIELTQRGVHGFDALPAA